jgi:hypothetical protein
MPPALEQDLGLEQRIEDLAIEKLGAEFPVERFDIAILPRASGLDERLKSNISLWNRMPSKTSFGSEMTPVISGYSPSRKRRHRLLPSVWFSRKP